LGVWSLSVWLLYPWVTWLVLISVETQFSALQTSALKSAGIHGHPRLVSLIALVQYNQKARPEAEGERQP
jgi:hypothetical protein